MRGRNFIYTLQKAASDLHFLPGAVISGKAKGAVSKSELFRFLLTPPCFFSTEFPLLF